MLEGFSKFGILLAILVLIWSCKEQELQVKSEDVVISIAYSSGDDFFYESEDSLKYFAPYPFNVGYFEGDSGNVEIVVISKKLKQGSNISVSPIAKMTIGEPGNVQKDIFVALPLDRDLRIIEGDNFYNFTVEQFSFKQIIEIWYSNRYGLQGTTIKGWSPATKEIVKSL